MISRHRNAAVVVVAVFVATVLSGCTLVSAPPAAPTARSAETVEAEVAQIPGVSLRVGEAFNGFTPYLSISVEVAPEFTGDIATLLDYVLAEVWSQDEVAPEKSVVIGVDAAGHTGAMTIEELGSLDVGASIYAQSSVTLNLADLERRYGTWPAAAPTLPAALTAGSVSPSSRSLATIESALAAIPGVQFTAARGWDGTTPYVIATLSATDAFTGDPAALVDYALAQLASQEEIDRGRFVRFTFDAPGQTADTTQALLTALDIDSERYAGGSSLELSSEDLDRRYGIWPAVVPDLPTTLGGTG